MESVSLDVEGASWRAGDGKLTISETGVEFAPGFLSFTPRRQWPKQTLKLEVRKGLPFAANLLWGLPLFLIFLLLLVGPILAILLWPIAAIYAVWKGLSGTYVIVDGDAGRTVYLVKHKSVAEVRGIVDEQGLA
jgi:hypothetical protein